MNKCLGHIVGIITAVVVCVLLVLSSCSTPNHEGFAIYLTKGDIPPAQMPVLSHVDIAEQPIIAMNDIITYNAQTHELKLTANAFERISQLDVPVRGKSFVVCVDREPVYWGAFWTPVSSISFNGVTIWKPFSSQEPKVITLELGYPSPSFYGGEDPRNNPEVTRALDQAGKLITKLSITAVDELPHSMKGYELYSWLQDSQWNFTLITGTNRNKTLAEIVSNEDFISEAGWVQIHVAGVDAIKAVLSKLPQNEHVFWLAGMRSVQTSQGSVNITLPEGPTINTIKEHAELCSLDFMVQTPLLNDVEISLAPIHEVKVSIMKSNPPQIGVYIKGGLRDGCTTFHDIEIAREGSTVTIKVTTQHPKDTACPAVYGFFKKNINLGSDFAVGTTYTLNVNDYTTTFVY